MDGLADDETMSINLVPPTTTTATMIVIPPWLQDHCDRLVTNDENLTNLNLNIRRLDSVMMEALVAALQQNSVLSVLNMTSSLTHSPNAIEPLTRTLLPHHPSLKILHLSHNRLTNISLSLLATNTVLTELYLEYNALGQTACEDLAKGLQHNTSLTVLQLNYNQVGDAGCRALAEALRSNQSLRTLGLERNGIADASHLRRVLQHENVWLERLRLGQNNALDDAAVRTSIQLYCRANAAGRRFLRHCTLPEAAWPMLLHRLAEDSELRYFFLREKPDLLCHHSTDCSNNKNDSSTSLQRGTACFSLGNGAP